MLKLTKLFNGIKWTAVTLSLITLTTSPVAMGASAQKKTSDQLKLSIQKLGLNKKMTFGEFYKTNKNVFPVRIQKKIEGMLPKIKNQQMPTFEVVTTKTTTGENVPTIRLVSGKELINIQWYGEENRVVKFQNTNLSNVDIINFNDMFVRILAGDERYRKNLETKPKARMYSKFKYPDVSLTEWRSMSARAKSEYLLNIRHVWQQARVVLQIKEDLKKKKTSQFQIKNKLFYELFFGQRAEAVGRQLTANSCIVAGYVSEYEQNSEGEVCSVSKARTNYGNDELFRLAAEKCGSGQLACNPYVYGAPNGNPICLSPARAGDFQRATHFNGPCDSASRLQSSNEEVQFLRDSDPRRGQGRYSTGNMIPEVELRSHFEQDHRANRQLTENYIMGVLKLRGLTTESEFSNVVLNDESLLKIKEIRDQFTEQIERARAACVQVADGGGTFERNYWQACDQLHRRFLFVDVILQERCEAGGLTYNSNTLKCSCAGATAGTSNTASTDATAARPAATAGETIPGAACPAARSAATPPPAATPVSSDAVPARTQAEVCDIEPTAGCICPNGRPPSARNAVTSASSGAVAGLTCENQAVRSEQRNERNCGLGCQVGRGAGKAFNFFLDALPYLVVGGVALYALHTMSPEKPKLQPPADNCPNGTPPPCLVTCPLPKVQLPGGACGCPACPIGQSPNASCSCVSGSTGTNPTRQLCPDDVTYVDNLATCPKYPCGENMIDDPRDCVLPPATTESSAPAGTTN